jgi:hypothetical protein
VLATGAGREAFAAIRSITDVVPAILTALAVDQDGDGKRRMR